MQWNNPVGDNSISRTFGFLALLFWQKKMGQQFSIVPSDIPQEHKQVVGRLLIKVITIFKIFYKNCYIKLCILFNCNAQINHFNDNLLRKLKDYINNLRKKLKR